MPQAPAKSESGGGDRRGDRDRVEQAVRDLRAGKRVDESFDFLFRRFSPPLLRQLISWGADVDEAHDLNQEIFQRIFQRVDSFQGDHRLFESWVGWIWKIARTTWLRRERFKRAAKRHQDYQPLEGIDEMSLQAAQPSVQLDRVLDQEARRLVRDAIDQLPEQELKCVILYYYQGRKTRELSVILRIAEGTVKAHLSHARAKLRKRLGDYFEFDDDASNFV